MWHYHAKHHPFHPKHHPRNLEESAREEILTFGMWRLFAKFAVPSIFGMLMYAVYIFIDAVFVGQWVGKEGLAAISIVYPLTLINTGITAFMGMGCASLLSRAIGSGNKDTVSRILGINTLLILIFSAVFMILGYAFAEPLVRFLGGRGTILSYGVRYFRIVVLGSFFFNFIGSTNMLMRAEGRIKEAMIIITLGSVLNIILDPLFIRVLGMGVRGAAIATVISMFVTSMVTLLYYLVGNSELSFNGKGFFSSFHLMRDIVPVGASGLAMQLMTVIQQVIIFKSIGFYGGGDELALMGATLNMFAFALIPMWGISMGLQPIIGMNYGAEKYGRVKEAFYTFLLAATAIAFVVWAVFMLFPDRILGMYLTEPALVASGANAFRMAVGMFLLQGFLLLPATLFQSIGKGGLASVVLLTREILLFVPLVVVLPLFMDLWGVWISIPIADAAIAVLASILFIVVLRSLKTNEHEKLKKPQDRVP
jgi:putative MATE family efflux protein